VALNFPGPLSIAVAFVWKSDVIGTPVFKVPGRLAVANDRVTEFTINGSGGGTSITIGRRATKKNPLFDTNLNVYRTDKVSGAALDKILAAGSGAKFQTDLTFGFETFFDVMLQHLTNTDGTENNLGKPKDEAPVLATFVHSVKKSTIHIDYQSDVQKAVALPCSLVDSDVKPGKKGKPPEVKLVFEIDLLTGIDDKKREIMRKFIAMDWSELAHKGDHRITPQPAFVRVWWTNVMAYLCNHTDITRGERIRRAIVGRHQGKTARALSSDCRNDIDANIITANHWGQAREDMKTERYQRLLSDLFGTLHQTRWFASPVNFSRNISTVAKLDSDQDAALTLQYGAGHCGEHSGVSFSILRELAKTPGNNVSHVVKTGNANIDHAFVVYNLELKESVLTLVSDAQNSRASLGDQILVFDLKKAIADNPTREGFLMDPYLDASVAKPTARELLDALNNKRRKASGKDTDFLALDDFFPAAPAPAQTDLTGAPLAERKKKVRHV
jgi:hypothetical protein